MERKPPVSPETTESKESNAPLANQKSEAVVLGSFKVPEGFTQQTPGSIQDLVSGHPILQSYCHKIGKEYVLQMAAPTAAPAVGVGQQTAVQEQLNKAPSAISIEKIEPIKVSAVPLSADEYAICIRESSGLLDTKVGESIIKDFKESLLTGVPVVRKTWMEEFEQGEARGKSAADSPIAWNLEHVFANYQFRTSAAPLIAPEHLVLLDNTFSSRLTSTAVNSGVTKFAIMTSLFDQFIQHALKQSGYIIGSPLILRELDAGPSNGVMDYCVMRSHTTQTEMSQHFVETFRAIQASLLHHVPMSVLAPQLGPQARWCYDYLIAYLPKGLVDQDEATLDHAGDYLDRLVSFEGARGGLLIIEFYEEFGLRLALASDQFSKEQVSALTDQFKNFALSALASR